MRRIVFGKSEKRSLMDMHRSGAVEANAGGAAVETIAAKMANSIDKSKALQKTYMPVNWQPSDPLTSHAAWAARSWLRNATNTKS